VHSGRYTKPVITSGLVIEERVLQQETGGKNKGLAAAAHPKPF